MPTILDSNVILDILHEDAIWFSWSARQIRMRSEAGKLIVNAIIFAEASLRYASFGEYKRLVGSVGVELEDIPWRRPFWRGRRKTSTGFQVGAANAYLPISSSAHMRPFEDMRF